MEDKNHIEFADKLVAILVRNPVVMSIDDSASYLSPSPTPKAVSQQRGADRG